jgi:uncharacterized protein (DUF433 family)
LTLLGSVLQSNRKKWPYLSANEWISRQTWIPAQSQHDKDFEMVITAEVTPIEIDATGIARVGGTRVILDTVVAAFKDGATAAEIIYQYPTLSLADVYSVVGHYLRYPEEIEAYLERRKVQATSVRQRNESRFDPQGVRDRLLARRAAADT